MIDWDSLVLQPSVQIFGRAVSYSPSPRSPIFTGQDLAVSGVLSEAYDDASDIGQPGVNSTHPVLGIRVAEFPTGFDPALAQGDMFTIVDTGRVYIVQSGRPDGRGGAHLHCLLQDAG